MIIFLKCAALCVENDAEKKHDSLIKELNRKFRHFGCACHPDWEWRIAVDLMSNCKFKFHDNVWNQNPSCGFWDILYKNEVLPYLENQ